MLIDLFDHVALLQIGAAKRRIDIGYDDSVDSVWKIELASECRCEFANLNSTQTGRAFILVSLIGILLNRRLDLSLRPELAGLISGRLFFDVGRDRHRFSAAFDFQIDFLVQVGLRNESAQLVKIFDVVAIELANHIAFLKMRVFRRRARNDFIDDHAVGGRGGLALLSHFHLHSEIAANDAALFQQTFQSRPHGVGRNCESHPGRRAAGGYDRGIYPDDFAAEIDQRATAVAGVNRGIGLQ